MNIWNVLIFCLQVFICFSEKIPIKIVDDPVNYEHGNLDTSLDTAVSSDDADWLSTVHPANFSGPEHMRQLLGRCFYWNNFKYRYDFCPFQNITQREISSTWNPYKGVLGVWGDWRIRGNHFTEMLFTHGDSCEGGAGNRSVEIRLHCNESLLGHVSEVTEPDRCHYLVHFSTQLVCHPHALLVYPRLSKLHQNQWDLLYTQHTHKLISDKDFDIGVVKIFENAGLVLSDKARENLRSTPQIRRPSLHISSPCELQVERLRHEVESLREELARLTGKPEEVSNAA